MKLEIQKRNLDQEYVSKITPETKAFFNEYRIGEWWNVVDTDTQEIIGGGATREKALDTLSRIGGQDAI